MLVQTSFTTVPGPPERRRLSVHCPGGLDLVDTCGHHILFGCRDHSSMLYGQVSCMRD